MSVDNTRPPYVQWETRAIEDRSRALEEGHYASKDVDYVVVTRPGSRDTLDKEALVWISEIAEKARKGDIPSEWAQHFKQSYKMWKEGQEMPINGTPIKGWPVLSPAAQKDLLHIGIRSVEDLAEFSDSELALIGMGALGFKLKAQNWLKSAKDTGKHAEQLTTQAQQISELTELVKKLNEELKKRPLPETAKA